MIQQDILLDSRSRREMVGAETEYVKICKSREKRQLNLRSLVIERVPVAPMEDAALK